MAIGVRLPQAKVKAKAKSEPQVKVKGEAKAQVKCKVKPWLRLPLQHPPRLSFLKVPSSTWKHSSDSLCQPLQGQKDCCDSWAVVFMCSLYK